MYYFTKNEDPNNSEYNYDPEKGDLIIMNAAVIWPDFGARRAQQQFRSNTRSCTVMLSEDVAQVLRENHINVKYRENEDGSGFYFIGVKLSYHTPEDEARLGFKPADPEVKLKRIQNNSVNVVDMLEEDIAELDSIRVERCDMVLHHGKKLNQNGNFSLYINKMGCVYNVNDPFNGMYDAVPVSEDIPF